jgi:hypothetical protein
MDRAYWLPLRIQVPGYSSQYSSRMTGANVFSAGDGFDALQELKKHNGYVGKMKKR